MEDHEFAEIINMQAQNISGHDTAGSGVKTIPAMRTPTFQSSQEGEIVMRLDAEVSSLKQIVQFQQDLLLKQHDALAQQQDITKHQLAPVHAQVYNQAQSALSSALDAGLSKVVNHPVGANYLSNSLFSLTVIALAAIGGYFKHSPDTVTATLVFVSTVLSISATAISIFSAASKKITLRLDRLSNLAMGAACLGFLAILVRLFWHAFSAVPHVRQFFWMMFGVEIAVVLAANIAFSTLSFALQPVFNKLKNNLLSKGQRC